jgi:hypothetical protein
VPSAGRSPLTYDRVYGKVLLGKAHGTPRGPVVGKQVCGAKLELWSEIISMGEKLVPVLFYPQKLLLEATGTESGPV